MKKNLSIVFVLFNLSAHSQNASPFKWLNAPQKWSAQDHQLTVRAEPKTDFWRVTHYGYITDNGHFYYQEIENEFTAKVKLTNDE